MIGKAITFTYLFSILSISTFSQDSNRIASSEMPPDLRSSFMSGVEEPVLSEKELDDLLGLIRPGSNVNYPNPFTGKVKLVLQLSKGSIYDFNLVDQGGITMLQQIYEAETSGGKTFEFNLSSLKDGWYFLRVSGGEDAFQSYRILKAN